MHNLEANFVKNRSGLVDSILVVASDEPDKLGIQKHLFLHQLTHNMMTDCSLNYKFSRRKLQVQLFLCFCVDIQNKLCMYTTYTELVVSCPEREIQSFIISKVD